jgi:hypothetical protein
MGIFGMLERANQKEMQNEPEKLGRAKLAATNWVQVSALGYQVSDIYAAMPAETRF